MKNVTAIIKTFERPAAVRRLVESIRRYYPHLPILVGDDSLEPQKVEGTELIALPFDIGLSAGRNRLVDAVQTEYTLLLDDDFVFEPRTRIEDLLPALRSGVDLASGQVNGEDYHGTLLRIDRTLHYIFRQKRRMHAGMPLYDMTWNFFLARTSKLKELRWDEDLKVSEHTDFFLRGMSLPEPLKVTHVPRVNVGHIQEKVGNYAQYRQRGVYYAIVFMQKHGLVRSINYRGKEKTLMHYIRQYELQKHKLAQH